MRCGAETAVVACAPEEHFVQLEMPSCIHRLTNVLPPRLLRKVSCVERVDTTSWCVRFWPWCSSEQHLLDLLCSCDWCGLRRVYYLRLRCVDAT